MQPIEKAKEYFDFEANDEEIRLARKAELPSDCTDLFATINALKRHRKNTIELLKNPGATYKKVVAVDIETTDLDPMKGEIRLVSVAETGMSYVVDSANDIKELLADSTILKVFHNATFDVKWLRMKGYEVVSYSDTLIMAQVSRNHVKCNNSLQGLAKTYLNIDMDKSHQHATNWKGELSEEHRRYALLDAEVTLELFHLLRKEIEQRHLDIVLRRELAALDAVIEISVNGIAFDYEGWAVELSEMEEQANILQCQVRASLDRLELNLQSPAQIIEALRTNGIDEIEGSADEVLAKYESRHEAIPLLRRYKKIRKQINSFGVKLKDQIDSDGRIRANWRLIGTDTSRMSCKQPNLQGMPGISKPYFFSKERHSFIIADYSNIELRILAEITKDPELVKVFTHNEDLHTKTAAVILEKQSTDEVSDTERKIGKVVNFGLVYGMTKWGLRKKINTVVDTPITLEEAEVFRNRYFQLYKGVLGFQDRMLRSDFIQTLGGRYWTEDHHMLPAGAIARFNYPIQASGAEGLKEALPLFTQSRKAGWNIVAAIHDEIVIEVPDSEVSEATMVLEEAMIQGMKRIVQHIPIEVEISSSKQWG